MYFYFIKKFDQLENSWIELAHFANSDNAYKAYYNLAESDIGINNDVKLVCFNIDLNTNNVQAYDLLSHTAKVRCKQIKHCYCDLCNKEIIYGDNIYTYNGVDQHITSNQYDNDIVEFYIKKFVFCSYECAEKFLELEKQNIHNCIPSDEEYQSDIDWGIDTITID